MTMSAQVNRNRLDTNLIDFERLVAAIPDAVTGPRAADSDGHTSNQTQQAHATFRKRHHRRKESIDPHTVAARLNRLFDTIRPPGRGPLRNYEVIKALRARGIEMSAPYLSQLRSGRRTHPRLDMLRPLADFFGVSVAYFTDADSAYTRYLEAELCWLEMAHAPEVRAITTALLTLPPDIREDILQATHGQAAIGFDDIGRITTVTNQPDTD